MRNGFYATMLGLCAAIAACDDPEPPVRPPAPTKAHLRPTIGQAVLPRSVAGGPQVNVLPAPGAGDAPASSVAPVATAPAAAPSASASAPSSAPAVPVPARNAADGGPR
jgi:hypothetical protein